MPEYDGPERRRSYVELETALEKVEQLHGAVTTLATAVTNTVPRQEIEALKLEVKRDFLYKVYLQVALTIAFVIFFIVFVNTRLGNLDNSIKRGHEVILCMQGKTEAQRTGDAYQTSRVVCEQSTK